MISATIDFQDLRNSLPDIKYSYDNLIDTTLSIEDYVSDYFRSKNLKFNAGDVYKIINMCCDLGMAKISSENRIIHYFEWI
jgi:hypothetical protein